jgi:hypothetical protein
VKIVSVEASDQEILDAVREWVGLLIAERYADACAFLHHEDDPHLPHWTPELMRTLIQNYGSLESRHNDEVFKITSLEEAKVDPPKHMPPRHEVDRFQDDHSEGSVGVIAGGKTTEIHSSDTARRQTTFLGSVWFDLPLNGYWSDLTATLDLRVLNNQVVFELNDIHVM